jgi:putative membrane protein insertion efficiency factor
MGQISNSMRKVMAFPVKLYQYVLSPYIKPCCRFYPSCSQYALDALEHHGIIKGLWFATYRLFRCHPWSSGGYDPVLHNPKEKN